MLRLEQIPMRKDNYAYALIENESVIMIDPSEEHESEAYFLKNPNYKLRAILNTHSHEDHIGGNDVLFKRWQCPIYGPKKERERIKNLTNPLEDLDEIDLFGITIRAHDVRAHTIGHLAYYVNMPVNEIIKCGHGRKPFIAKELEGHRVMFVGDSLFAAGCGRLFEGTTQNLLDCLLFYDAQDADLLMACAHEYTKANLLFAKATFAHDLAISQRLNEVDSLLAKEGSTLPCSFGLEQKTNPFLLALKPPFSTMLAKRFSLNEEDLRSIVGALRQAKDDF